MSLSGPVFTSNSDCACILDRGDRQIEQQTDSRTCKERNDPMKRIVLSVALVLLATGGSLSFASAPPVDRQHERSNRALLLSSQHRAQADFWLCVGESLAEPPDRALRAIQAAYSNRRSAEALALQVFTAREKACAMLGHVSYDPQIIPAQFGTAITNPYAQVSPGTTLIRERSTARGVERIETSMSTEVTVIGGVACRTVREHELLDGVLAEDTLNWVSQHQNGAVWYFGEVVMKFEDGVLDNLQGSWRYGVEGVHPGVLALATPAVGEVYRQEYWLGRAEDIARVVRLDATVVVPAGVFEHCLVIEEWDPLEPFEYLLSFIAPNVGLVLEIDQGTGERSELVQIVH